MIFSVTWVSFFLTLAASTQAFVTEPKGCFTAKKFPCAVYSGSSVAELKLTKAEVRLASDTSIVIGAHGDLKILSGQVYFVQAESAKVNLIWVDAVVNGKSIIKIGPGKPAQAACLDGSIKVTTLQEQALETLVGGFENWYSGLNTLGEVYRGMPRPFDVKEVILDSAKTFDIAAQEIKKLSIQLVSQQHQAIEESAKLYEDVAQRRKLASENEQERIERIREKDRLERQALRRMFRERNSFGSLQ